MNDAPIETNHHHLAIADVYRLLSACYYQPEEAFVEEEVFGQLKTALAEVNPQLVIDAAAMDESFRNSDPETLMLDYSRLFLGPLDILAKPYGSVYLDGEKVVMGDSTMQALSLYREGGFDLADDFREVPDHVAAELEFLYLLSFRIGHSEEPDERSRLIALKKRFLVEHLGRWIGDLAESIRKGAETEFYRRLAAVTEKFVRQEMQKRTETG